MMAVLTIQKYAWRNFSSNGAAPASCGSPCAVTGPRYSSATSNVRGAATGCGLVGDSETRWKTLRRPIGIFSVRIVFSRYFHLLRFGGRGPGIEFGCGAKIKIL